jgi:hypothetical protein
MQKPTTLPAPLICHLNLKNKIMLIKRREFLKISSLATASMLMPNFLKAMTLDDALNPIRTFWCTSVYGGNDGLEYHYSGQK